MNYLHAVDVPAPILRWLPAIAVLIGGCAFVWTAIWHVPWKQVCPEDRVQVVYRPLHNPSHLGMASSALDSAEPITQSVDVAQHALVLCLVAVATFLLWLVLRWLTLGAFRSHFTNAEGRQPHGGRDWITLTGEQIENDQLPDVCIVCGVFPGLIVATLTEKTQRIPCPVCMEHRNHWSRLAWFASLGWLLPPALRDLVCSSGSLWNLTALEGESPGE